MLGAGDRVRLNNATATLDTYCATGNGRTGADAAADEIVTLLRDHAGADAGGGRSVREAVSSTASDLDGCAGSLARRLDRALRDAS